jgi:PAS domain S-box-containing protein
LGSEKTLDALLRHFPDPLIVLGTEGRVLAWSRSAERHLGIGAEAARDRMLHELLSIDDPERLVRLSPRLDSSSEPLGVRLRRPDGLEAAAELLLLPLPGDGGTGERLAVLRNLDGNASRSTYRELNEELIHQAEELQAQAAHLEEAQVELEMANDELQRANVELSTRTREAEEATRTAEEVRDRLEAVLRQMPSGVIIAEAPSGRIVLSNTQVDRIWGHDQHGAAGVEEYVTYAGFHPGGRPYRAEEWPLARSLTTGERVINEEIEILRADGSQGTISASSSPILNRDGEVVAGVVVFDDITERKIRERELAYLAEASRVLGSSLDYRDTLAMAARLAVPQIADWCAIDVLEEGSIQRLAVAHPDPGLERLAEELHRRWPPDPDAPHGVSRALQTGEPELIPEISDDLIRAIAQDEEHLRIISTLGLRSAMVVPMIARGRVLGAITLVAAESGRLYRSEDLPYAEQLAARAAIAVDNARLFERAQTAQREAEYARGAAEAANRAKSEFLATMSHEIRTPINAIVGYADLLELEIGGPLTPKQRDQVSRIKVSSEHLRGLIEDVLDLAKVEAGRLEVSRERKSIVDAVRAAIALVEPQANLQQIELRLRCPDGGLSYVGDEVRVRQILVNILSNAIKFTDGGGVVTLECGSAAPPPSGPEATASGAPLAFVRVSDTGIGIAPDDLEVVFRPFEQVERGHTRTRGGTGLGLTISRQLVRLMGGDITVESEPARGSTFTVWLPTQLPETGPRAAEVLDRISTGSREDLAEVGRRLRGEVPSILEAFVERLRADPLPPDPARLAAATLEDHTPALLNDLAQGLVALGEVDRYIAEHFYDGTDIQAVISELHGAQRARLGWSGEALSREFAIMREEVQRCLDRILPAGESRSQASGILEQLLRRAEQLSLEALRRTATQLAEQPEL